MPATNAINTPERIPGFIWQEVPIAAAVTVFVGSLCAVDAAGNLKPASDTAALKVIGRFEGVASTATAAAAAANTLGGDAINTSGAAGDVKGNVKRGVFRFTNYSLSLCLQGDIGQLCYVFDDFTVRKTVGVNTIVAGVVTGVDADGVWVDTRLKTAI